jgi:hypothetical protein
MDEIRAGEFLETDLRLADRQAREQQEAYARVETPLRESILQAINSEVERAKRHGEKFASLHEAYAVILKELDEVWEITRQKRRDRSVLDLRKEFIQIGAMAVKALESIDHFVGGSV